MKMVTYTGREFDLLNPNPGKIVIEDVAHSLALTTRFNGHCHRFYSVAQHSYEVSNHVDPCDASAALLHDAAEAYTGDIIAPIKDRVPVLCDMITCVEAAVAIAFGLPYPMPSSVVQADKRMLATEMRDLMNARLDWEPYGLSAPYPGTLVACDWQVAELHFLERYKYLLGIPLL